MEGLISGGGGGGAYKQNKKKPLQNEPQQC